MSEVEGTSPRRVPPGQILSLAKSREIDNKLRGVRNGQGYLAEASYWSLLMKQAGIDTSQPYEVEVPVEWPVRGASA